ncbi:MAG: exopolygalacturonase [Tannerella sp.]|jgi:polygalacturonase|nr:exopolygalacturonase [Tannerella sp.]
MTRKNRIITALLICNIHFAAFNAVAQGNFPDGTPVPSWFSETKTTDLNSLGQKYIVTDYGVKNDSTALQTKVIQSVIDRAAGEGGGVIIIPKGVFLSGSLFFKPKTHLHLEEGATLKGSDDIADFEIVVTRIEGQTLKYFAALINADRVDGFTISGKGTVNGNGLRYWKAFWLRRQWNPQCTNMDEMRPRLIYISNSKDVQLSDVKLMNSPFWTTHLYKCKYVKLLNLHITSPASPVKAPSTDAIDLDVCSHILVKGCYMAVNDDAIALKGGKGPFADQDENNGENCNIIIEDCTFGFCHSALTCGSESIHTCNVIFRRSKVEGAHRLLQLKMRPDTPQRYEHILLDEITGNTHSMIDVKPWTQFFDLKGETGMRLSYANNIAMRNIKLDCKIAFNIADSNQYYLSGFSFTDVSVTTEKSSAEGTEMINGLNVKNMKINGKNFAGETGKALETGN